MSDPTSGSGPACGLLASDRVDRIPTTNSVMTPFPYVVQVDDGLLYAREVMVHHRVRHLPEAYIVESSEPLDNVLEHMSTEHPGSALVTKGGHLVGIFTATDACRVFCWHLRAIFPRGSGDAVA